MAEYGCEVRDASGRVVLDNKHLTHRLWYSGVHSEDAIVTYATPLNHEPTLFVVGINGRGAPVEHRKSGSQYIGFQVNPHPRFSASDNFVVVFARE